MGMDSRVAAVSAGGVVISNLSVRDLPALGRRFADHAGRPADLEVLGSWIDASPGVGAHVDDQLVGYIVTKPFGPEVVELASMLVAPEARGRGIGRDLLDRLERECRASGAGAIVLVTSSGYEVAEERRDPTAFYERAGYRVVASTARSRVLARELGGA
jgi:GNAT superfamily N-acetyltransferase